MYDNFIIIGIFIFFKMQKLKNTFWIKDKI